MAAPGFHAITATRPPLVLLIGVLLLAITKSVEGESDAAPFALVELFTSEGCSSCPRADKLLAEMDEDARKSGRRIFPIAFHVDYWDGNWTDRFSSPASTRRQHLYVRALDLRAPYTPQMIVNGTDQFVGLDAKRAKEALDAALQQAAGVGVTLKVVPDGDAWKIAYELTAAPKGSVLCVALVESGLVTKVSRGENGGRTLAHTNVVRSFITVPLGDGIKGEWTWQTGVPVTKNSRWIAFVQDREMAILGATSLDP